MLSSNDTELMSKALVGIVFGTIQRKCVCDTLMAHVRHPSFWVAKNAIVGLEELVLFNPSIDVGPIIQCLMTVDETDQLDHAKYSIKGILEISKKRDN